MTWKINDKYILMAMEVWSIVSGTEERPHIANRQAAYDKRMAQALTVIECACSPKVASLYLTGAENPKEM